MDKKTIAQVAQGATAQSTQINAPFVDVTAQQAQPQQTPAETPAQPAKTSNRKIALADIPKVAAQQNNLVGFKQNNVFELLSTYKSQISKMLPSVLTPDRLLSFAADTIYHNPKLMECTPASLVGAVMQSAMLGFPPISSLGLCYFIPYGSQCQFQIGYKGLINLASRTGEFSYIKGVSVYANDKFHYSEGAHPDLIHEPVVTGDRGDFVGAYAIAKYKDYKDRESGEIVTGDVVFTYLSKGKIENLRRMSKSQGANPSGAWAINYEKMAWIKAVRQLLSTIPLSIDASLAMEHSDGKVLTPENFNDGEYSGDVVDFEEAEIIDTETGEISK